MATQQSKNTQPATTKPDGNEAKFFSVKNESARLISVLGKQLAPGQSENLEDNPFNRATVKDVEGLIVGKPVDEEENELSETEQNELDAIAKANAPATAATATGASWSK